MHLKSNRPSTLVVAITLAILTGCSTKKISPDPEFPNAISQNASNPEQLLAMALTEQNPGLRASFLLQAASLYWRNNLVGQSKAAWEKVDQRHLDDAAWRRFWMLGLDLAIYSEDVAALNRILPNVEQPAFAMSNPDRLSGLAFKISQAYALLERPIDAAVALIEYSGVMEEENRLNEQIWKYLRGAELNQLSTFNYAGDNYDVNGWLALAKTIRLNSRQLQEQYLALTTWVSQWSLHPAAIQLPHELSILMKLPESRPKNIVLALPFSGPLAPVSAAIRDGLLASYYSMRSRAYNTESNDSKTASASTSGAADEADEINITIFDTHTKDFFSLYNGSLPPDSIIIGPLQKELLATLLESDALPVKTLALNYIESQRIVENLFQFSLNPEHETRQVAERMHEDSIERIGILAPESDWGLRIYDSFNKANHALGNTLVESAFYDSQKTLSDAVAHMLATDLSKQRSRLVGAITGLRLESTPRRRQDIDAVFMVAKAEIAKQLKPLLAYHYASDLPVYATSQINDLDSEQGMRDLNGVKFVDMPWSLSSTVALRRELELQFPENALRYSRFYAMGIDALQIAPRIELLTQVEDSEIEGQTGNLSILENNVVNRTLQWAKFRAGKPVVIN